MKIKESILEKCLNDISSKKQVYSAVLRVENGDGTFAWEGAKGDMKPDSKYFIASVTKLYVTAVVLSLIEKHKLKMEDKIVNYLPQSIIENLHVLNGVDYSKEITIKHLISNTSGLPDYFFYKESDKKSAASMLFKGQDEAWEPEKTIQATKKMIPKFVPGKKGKVYYSDTNYQLLGRIIETVAGNELCKVFDEIIFDRLNLNDTYIYHDVNDQEPVPFYYGAKKLWLPRYMSSIACEGGIVSTAREVMVFLKEFFKGSFFAKEKIEELKDWKLLMPPPGMFYFGIGLEKSPTPRIISLFKPIKEIIGFWGQVGSFAWYNPDTDLYFTGTTNQSNGIGHAAAMNAIIKIIKLSL